MTSVTTGRRGFGSWRRLVRRQVGRGAVSLGCSIMKTGKGRALAGQVLDRMGFLLHRANPDHVILFQSNDFIGRRLMASGEFERGSMRDVVALLASRGLMPSGGTFLELGANIGTHTVYASREHHFERFVCLEPEATNHAILLKNLTLNGLTGRAVCPRVAASSVNGTTTFQKDPGNSGRGRIVATGEGELDVVETVKVDDLLRDLGIAPGDLRLVWVDVEGHELGALRGLSDALRQARPPLFFELTPDAHDAAAMTELMDLVFGTYDEVFAYRGGLEPISRNDATSLDGQIDILALASR